MKEKRLKEVQQDVDLVRLGSEWYHFLKKKLWRKVSSQWKKLIWKENTCYMPWSISLEKEEFLYFYMSPQNKEPCLENSLCMGYQEATEVWGLLWIIMILPK
jgi:hypothetical protein